MITEIKRRHSTGKRLGGDTCQMMIGRFTTALRIYIAYSE